MRAALAVNLVSGGWEENLAHIEVMINEAADAGAQLILFPETALTGLINNDDPAHDLPLGQPIPGPATRRLGDLARDRGIYVAIGLFELDGGRLYDSAILIDPAGEIVLQYRRISRGWRSPRADPAAYGEGDTITKVETPHGSFAFLICGDLGDDELLDRVRALDVDWLLFPFARNFNDNSYDQERWDRDEEPWYRAQAARTGSTTLMVNYLADPAWEPDRVFGGALVVAPSGEAIAKLRLGQAGLLVVDLEPQR